ncbi:MAG: hypothetical protein P8Y43_09540, partial [Sulfurovaceae bacterium]
MESIATIKSFKESEYVLTERNFGLWLGTLLTFSSFLGWCCWLRLLFSTLFFNVNTKYFHLF